MNRPTLLLAFILAIFATRNLPWHLDDYDQAKQAFTSYEMVTQGHWWFQHTPTDRIATKPPLAGWISAGLYKVMGGHGWPIAWRLPSFLCAVALLAMLWRAGGELGQRFGALLAAAAFGLNLTAPRLATLVRTDMMLTFFIFVVGWLVFEKIRRDEPWSSRERWWLFAAVLASMLTKGPIAYAFLLPGIVAYAWIMRRQTRRSSVWAGWWPWFAPLIFFGAWVWIGIRLSPEFYEQVVQREFLGRFTVGEAAVHNNQPVYFYLLHVLHKWLPWSAGLIALCCARRAREAIRSEPAILWLACWAIGGLIVMSLVPSKRADRIFPVIPPLCLLLAAVYERVSREEPRKCRKFAAVAIGFALLFSGGYTVMLAVGGHRSNQAALVDFGARVRSVVAAQPERLAVVNGKDEGMVMYTGVRSFTSAGEAMELWRTGKIDWLVLGEGTLKKRSDDLQPYRRVLEVPKLPKKTSGYVLLGRPGTE